MKIGIIGAGNIGGTLARKFVAAGHIVKLAGSKGPDSIRELAEKIGAEPVTAAAAVEDVEVIVLSIPFAKIPEVAGLFSTVPAEVVVIDTSNYYPQLGTRIPEVEDGKLESVWSSEQLGRPIIKAFNAAPPRRWPSAASLQARKTGLPSRWRATVWPARRSRSSCWTMPGSTRSMRGILQIHGGCSPARLRIAPSFRLLHWRQRSRLR